MQDASQKDPLLADQQSGETLTGTQREPLFSGLFDGDEQTRRRQDGEPSHGTLFYTDDTGDGLDGFIVGGQAALYGSEATSSLDPNEIAELLYGDVALAHDLNPTTDHEETLNTFLSGDAYLAELADVDGQRWAARLDPWDGP